MGLMFLAYVAVLTADPKTRDLLTYARLVVKKVQHHGGPGWQEYDKIFCQNAALDTTVIGNKVNPSLHAAIVMTYRAGPSHCCGLCHELDHEAAACALLGLQPNPPLGPPVRGPESKASVYPQQDEAVHRVSRPEKINTIEYYLFLLKNL